MQVISITTDQIHISFATNCQGQLNLGHCYAFPIGDFLITCKRFEKKKNSARAKSHLLQIL